MTLEHICKCGKDGYNKIGETANNELSLEFLQCVFCGQNWTKKNYQDGETKWCPTISGLSARKTDEKESKWDVLKIFRDILAR